MTKYVVETFSVSDSQAIAILAVFFTAILMVSITLTGVKTWYNQKTEGRSMGDFILGWLSGTLCLICGWGLVNLFI